MQRVSMCNLISTYDSLADEIYKRNIFSIQEENVGFAN